MKIKKANILASTSLLILCCLLTGWLFSLPIPELKPSYKYLSYESTLILDKAKDRQLKCNNQGITSTAARFNAIPELSNTAYEQRVTLNFLFDYKNYTYYHTRLFYNSLRYINSHTSLHSPNFFILFRKLRL